MEQQLSIFDRRKTVVAVLRPTNRLIQTIVEIDGRLYFEQRHKEPFPPGHKYYQDTLPSRCQISRKQFERGIIDEIGKWTKGE